MIPSTAERLALMGAEDTSALLNNVPTLLEDLQKEDDRNKWEGLSTERKHLQAIGHLPEWYTTQGWQMFKKSYIVSDEAAVLGRHQAVASIADHLGPVHGPVFAQKFFDLLWQGVLSPATPSLANTRAKRGQPVSCSGQMIGDSVDSFYKSLHETAILSKNAFGTSGDFSSIRPRGSKFGDGGEANGASEVIDDFFMAAGKISQGYNRRGSFGAFIDIEHGDWDECADKLMRDSNGRNYGWTVRDSFIERLKANEPEAMRRFTKALHIKLVTGKGYYFFVDKANRHRPEMYKVHGLDVVATNLCTEIMLHSSEEFTYSCILSSMNLVHWDYIKNSDAVFVATVFLDCLCSEFLETSKGVTGLEKVRAFTEKGRAVGLGVMGFHTYLQSKQIPFISLDASFLNREIAAHMHTESLRASQWLAQEFGEPEWCKGFGVRSTHRIAYAPTKSTSVLMGSISESWFPDPGWVYESSSSAGGLNRIPPEFLKVMKDKGQYNEEVIGSIINDLGSVQNQDWLTDDEKLVFLNAYEMDQFILFRYAMARQPYTCQGQSLNFYIPGPGAEDMIAKLTTAFFMHPDCLSQYYFNSRSGVVVKDECISCSA